MKGGQMGADREIQTPQLWLTVDDNVKKVMFDLLEMAFHGAGNLKLH